MKIRQSHGYSKKSIMNILFKNKLGVTKNINFINLYNLFCKAAIFLDSFSFKDAKFLKKSWLITLETTIHNNSSQLGETNRYTLQESA